jgi:CRP-like cAMP-binding protein
MTDTDTDTTATALTRWCEILTRTAQAFADAADHHRAAIGTATETESRRALAGAKFRTLLAWQSFADAEKAYDTARAHDPSTWGGQ